MNLNEIKDIHAQLKQWREARHLEVKKQRENLLGNILEELTELARAKTEHEHIDALCDICVFTINSIPDDYNFNELFSDERRTRKNYYSKKAEALLLMSHISDLLLRDESTIGSGYHLSQILLDVFASMHSLGYDPYTCMLETIKEINSRTGHWDESLGKFVKDAGLYDIEEARAKFPNALNITENSNCFDVWTGDKQCEVFVKYYKADYSLARGIQ